MIKNVTLIILDTPGIKDFAKARNQAMAKAKTNWVLFVDKDEVVTDRLQAEIKEATKDKSYNYQLRRFDILQGQSLKYGEIGAGRFIRLIQKGTGKWQGKVHEVFVSKIQIKTLKNPLIHRRNLSFSQLLERVNWYSQLRAEEMFAQGESFKLYQLLFWPVGKFIQNYFLRLGFLDRFLGLTMAFLMSLHSFAVRVKLYGLEKNR